MNSITMLEAQFRGLVEADIPVRDILIAIHNTCAHGEIFKKKTKAFDKNLATLFDGFDTSLKALKEIER